MAQIDFFLCGDEKMEIANMLFSLNLKMIPDLSYESKGYIVIKNKEEYKEYVDRNILMFVVDESSDVYNSMVFGSFEKDGKTSFFVRQRYGKAAIDFYSLGVIEKEEHKIGPGFIGIYPFYYDNKGNEFYPSESDKVNFKKLSSFIKKMAKPVKLTNRTYWIGIKSIALCKQQGYELINIGDSNLSDLL